MVFYEGNPTKSFVATATLKTSSFQLTQEQREELSHGQGIYLNDYGVFLEETQILDKPIPIEQVVESLTFIENKEYWFSYFQGGTREIFEEDFYTITRALPTSLARQIKETEDLESESQFALEAHLEEFIFNNWDQIDFGENLVLYSDGEQNGRQFPAGT